MKNILFLIADELPDLDEELPDITIGQNGKFIFSASQAKEKQAKQASPSDESTNTNSSSSSYVFKVPQKHVKSEQVSQATKPTNRRQSTSSERTGSEDKSQDKANYTSCKQQKETVEQILNKFDEPQKKLKEVEEIDYHSQL